MIFHTSYFLLKDEYYYVKKKVSTYIEFQISQFSVAGPQGLYGSEVVGTTLKNSEVRSGQVVGLRDNASRHKITVDIS